MTLRLVVSVVVVAMSAGWASAAVGADEPAAGDERSSLSEACDPELLGDGCTSVSALAVVVASVCEEAGAPIELCREIDSGVADPAAVDAFERTWTAEALRLQHHLDDHVPLVQAQVPHTHNSYNSTAYRQVVSNLDPNQRYTVPDQLRMGMRAVELDLHWVGGEVVLCHGQSVPVGPAAVHAGCSVDRPFAEGLAELRDWLDAPANGQEFIILYLENQLDNDPAAHTRAAQLIEVHLGDLVIRPPVDGPCAAVPFDESQAQLTSSGGRVLIVGNCGPAGWGTWVHERGPRWDERNNTAGYPTYPDCTADRAERDYDTNWIRIWEDSTWLSAHAGSGSTVTVDEVRAMVRCGVNMVGFDRLAPDDPSLEALIWSWAPNEPAGVAGQDCAYRGADARFHSAGCDQRRAFACQTAEGTWRISRATGPWRVGPSVCRASGGDFAVPANGWENEQLSRAVADAGIGELWLNYRAVGDGWQVDAADEPNPAPTGGLLAALRSVMSLQPAA